MDGKIFAIVYTVSMLALFAAMYIMQSLGLYRIAVRRGIHHAGLSWVPAARIWVMGCISDQYQYLALKKTTNRRRNLIMLSILPILVAAMYLAFLLAVTAQSGNLSAEQIQKKIADMAAGLGSGMLLLMLAAAVSSAALTILQYMAAFDLFRSSQPRSAMLFLVLSILINVSMPIVIFACRNKDEGMPPRRGGFALPESDQKPGWGTQ